MFRKADRERLYSSIDRIEKEVKLTVSSQWAVIWDRRMAEIEQGMDKLLQSHAALKADLDALKPKPKAKRKVA